MLKITFAPSAFLEYMEYQKNNKNLKRINTLLKDIARNGDAGLGKVEKLTGDLSGYYSRRIDSKNRIIYRFNDEVCEIVQIGGHYSDK